MGEIRRIGFAADGNDLYMSNIPFGEYKVELAREQKGNWQDVSEGTQHITNDIIISVNTPLSGGNGGLDSYTGWTELTENDIAGDVFYWETDVRILHGVKKQKPMVPVSSRLL